MKTNIITTSSNGAFNEMTTIENFCSFCNYQSFVITTVHIILKTVYYHFKRVHLSHHKVELLHTRPTFALIEE